MGQRVDCAALCGGADMKIMQYDLPAPVEQRLERLESDSAAQRTAILKLERDVKRIINGCIILSFLVALLLWRAFL